MLKLNLGCGENPLADYVNVDKYGNPDLRCDLEVFPWPWQDGSVDEIVLHHVLEHLGESSNIYLSIMKEMYRVSKPNATIKITVPHPRHDDFLNDPTHVRPVTPDSLGLFSKRLNEIWVANKASNSPLGKYLDIDFELKNVNFALDEPWASRHQSGQISEQDLAQAARQFNNVIKEIQVELSVIK